MVDVTVERAMRAPRERVAALAMDPGNDARWILALDSVRVLGDGSVGAGTRVERIASFLGKRIEYAKGFYGVAGPCSHEWSGAASAAI